MKKKCKTKYKDGGELLSAIAPQAISMGLNALVPGLGSIASPIVGGLIQQGQQKSNELQMLNDHFNSTKIQTNPYGYENGGQLQGSENVSEFNGLSHALGGIDVNAMGVPSANPTAEVEGGETKTTIGGKTFIFSKTLRV